MPVIGMLWPAWAIKKVMRLLWYKKINAKCIVYPDRTPIFVRMELTSLKELRKKKGLSIIELARATKIGRETISKIERDLTDPRISTVRTILTALDASIMYLPDEYLNK